MPVSITQRCPACHQLKPREEFPVKNLPKKQGHRQHTHGRFCRECLKRDPQLPLKFDREPSQRDLER